jgi:hypothetical protein
VRADGLGPLSSSAHARLYECRTATSSGHIDGAGGGSAWSAAAAAAAAAATQPMQQLLPLDSGAAPGAERWFESAGIAF